MSRVGNYDLSRPGPQAGQSEDPGDGFWPERRTSVLDWLVNETRGERFLDNIFRDCCVRLRASGIPIARATMHLRLQHPQWFGSRVLWRPDLKDAELHPIELGITETDRCNHSPVGALHAGSAQVRKRLEEAPNGQDFPIYEELRREGLTDYVAWPLEFTLGVRHIIGS